MCDHFWHQFTKVVPYNGTKMVVVVSNTVTDMVSI